MPVTYSSCLEDWFTGLGAKTLGPKKYLSFLVSVVYISTKNMLK